MTNLEIIETEAAMIGFEYDGDNLKTFAQWKKAGYSVKKGEKAFIKCGLWLKATEKEKTEWVANDETGEAELETTGKTGRKFVMKTSFLFHAGQVEKIKKPSKKKAA